MSHEQLWAPWRLAYVANTEPKPTPKSDCFLCSYRDSSQDQQNLVLYRSTHAFVVLNRFPYNNGHLLVAPLAHKADLRELTPEESADCQRLLGLMVSAEEAVMKPDGFNIGLNMGRVAGAGLPGHLHWHIVPRWNGDTNFMPVISDTKVIPQSLEALYELLSKQLARE